MTSKSDPSIGGTRTIVKSIKMRAMHFITDRSLTSHGLGKAFPQRTI